MKTVRRACVRSPVTSVGTGPGLSAAGDRDWSHSLEQVCTCEHLCPQTCPETCLVLFSVESCIHLDPVQREHKRLLSPSCV